MMSDLRKYIEIDLQYLFPMLLAAITGLGNLFLREGPASVSVPVIRPLILTVVMATFFSVIYYLTAKPRIDQANRGERLKRLSKGYLSRIVTNICIFACMGIGIITFEFLLFSTIALPPLPYWNYVVGAVLPIGVLAAFFTFTTAILDLHARKQANS